MMNRLAPGCRKLRMEPLERRTLLSVDLLAPGGGFSNVLDIAGDANANQIQIEWPSPADPTAVRVTDLSGNAELNVGLDPLARVTEIVAGEVYDVAGTTRLRAQMGGENDVVLVTSTDLSVGKQVALFGQAGNDEITVNNARVAAVAAAPLALIDGGAGADVITVMNSVIENVGAAATNVLAGAGGDTVALEAVTLNTPLTVDFGVDGDSDTGNLIDQDLDGLTLANADVINMQGGGADDPVNLAASEEINIEGGPTFGDDVALQARTVTIDDATFGANLGVLAIDQVLNQLQVDGDLSLRGTGRNDTIGLSNSQVGGSMGIATLGGADTIKVLTVNTAGDVGVNSGDDNDRVTLRYSNSGGATGITTLGGDDTVELIDSDIGGLTGIDTGDGADVVHAIGLTTHADFGLTTGNGDDLAIVLYCTFIDDVDWYNMNIDLGAGDDICAVISCAGWEANVDGGAGFDVLYWDVADFFVFWAVPNIEVQLPL